MICDLRSEPGTGEFSRLPSRQCDRRMSPFRPPVRYDKHDENFLGLIQLACGLLWYRRLYRLKAR